MAVRVLRRASRPLQQQLLRPKPPPSLSTRCGIHTSPSTATAHTSSANGTSSSINAAEVSHFDGLSSAWWDAHGPMRLLHQMNPLRHDFIAACRAQGVPQGALHGLRYIDVGCGGGIFAESAARLASTRSVTAVDPSASVLKVARAHAATDPALCSRAEQPGAEQRDASRSDASQSDALRSSGLRPATASSPSGLAARLRYLNTGIEGLPVPQSDGDKADVLCLWEVIEHVDNPDAFLRACLPHVKPGGWLVLSTIARTWASWATTKLVAEDVLRIVPRGTHDWNKYINAEELREWFGKAEGWAGMEGSVRVEGVVYVPALGWRVVPGAEKVGNYFFGVRRDGER